MLLHIPDDTITQPQMSATPRRLRNPALQRNFVVLVTAAFLFAEKASQNLHVPLGPRNWVSSHVPET